MNSAAEKNKLLFRNTVFMYIRMFFVTIIGFFSSRLLLKNLGQEDFGIFNLVAGIITLISFLTTALSAATHRFVGIELGKGDFSGAKKVFSMALKLHFILTVLIIGTGIILAPFLLPELKIPTNRADVIFPVFYLELATCGINVLAIPFMTTIIVFEHIAFFSIITTMEAVLRVAALFLLAHVNKDQLICFSLLPF